MKKIFFFLLCSFASNLVFSQQEMLINGGFETVDQSITEYSPNPNPYPNPIAQAVGWHNLNNSCDLGYTYSGSSIPAIAHTGIANARFGIYGEISAEYFYKATEFLTAGQVYEISFWVRKDNSSSLTSLQVGMNIAPNAPTPQILPYQVTNTPQLVIFANSTTYQKASTCFTPTQSGIHYVTIGNFCSNPNGESCLFYVDDVSVKTFNGPFATSNLTMPNTTVCTGSDVIINGSLSVNETEYEWDIFEIENGTEVLKYNGVKQLGQAATINASSLLASLGIQPEEGKTYKVYLTVYNGCSDKEAIQFTYEKPIVQFLNSSNPICAGTPLVLSVSGDNGWTYSWSTGQTGTGAAFKSVTVNPPILQTQYSVTVTTTLGCTHTESINFVVHSTNNQTPTLNGINGTNNYTYYIQSGDIVSFTSTVWNDVSNEIITGTFTNISLPTSFYSGTFSSPIVINSLFSFTWDTGSMSGIPKVTPGIYTFNVTLDDNNVCDQATHGNVFTFTIIVVCDYCPLVIDYENRTPTGTPLPVHTEVGQKIIAGNTQIVETGSTQVTFQAGQEIELGPNFSAGAGFTGEILPSTCVTDCQDCCMNWTGFTREDMPEGFIVDFYDTDPTNDIFQVTDILHPFCAFGAIGYHLVISDSWGPIFESSYNENGAISECCPFESPAPENQITHSSIWWDPWVTNVFGKKIRPNSGTYSFILTFYGCNGASQVFQSFFWINAKTKSMEIEEHEFTEAENETMLKEVAQVVEKMEKITSEVILSPNPAIDEVVITGVNSENQTTYQLFDERGMMLTKNEELINNRFNVSALQPGFYFCKLRINGVLVTKKFEKM